MLELENISKRYRESGREHVVLRDVTLELRADELVAIWGSRRSGRTTLLRIAAGIETSDGGEVRFRGQRVGGRGGALGQGIGYVQKTLRGSEEQAVIEQVAAVALARGAGFAQAREQARDALRRVEAEHCSAMRISELTGGESLRVALARALCPRPSLLVVDEPTATARLGERDEILALLGRLATDGVAILASVSEPDELASAHRALTLSDGELRGRSSPALAPVVALRRAKM
ncbi:MAG TPA: ATP-binding cassette domain-containing protein [Solirubrobacteraceae bacterium]|nr:ATP-binding cassette domain-containing protein [Solirubrobacteraceae bacterium]